MNIGAEHAVEELIADGDAGERGAGIEQAQIAGAVSFAGLAAAYQSGLPYGDLAALDGEQVLDHEAAAGERSLAATRHGLLQSMRNEGVDRVVGREIFAIPTALFRQRLLS